MNHVIDDNKVHPWICPEPNGNFVDPSDCHNYYICIDGTAYRQVYCT